MWKIAIAHGYGRRWLRFTYVAVIFFINCMRVDFALIQ